MFTVCPGKCELVNVEQLRETGANGCQGAHEARPPLQARPRADADSRTQHPCGFAWSRVGYQAPNLKQAEGELGRIAEQVEAAQARAKTLQRLERPPMSTQICAINIVGQCGGVPVRGWTGSEDAGALDNLASFVVTITLRQEGHAQLNQDVAQHARIVPSFGDAQRL